MQAECPELSSFLDRLIRTGKIIRKDMGMLKGTLTGGKSLKDIASPHDYELLKHRRQQVMEHIKIK